MRAPTHTTVVAYLALFAAVSTSGALAVSVERGSIASRHLAADAVQRRHIDDLAVGAKQIGSLPFGQLTSGPASFDREAFDDTPITFDKAVFAQPRDAFDLAKGTFTAPVDGLYGIAATVVYEGSVDARPYVRLVEVDASGSPGPPLLESRIIDSDRQTNLEGPVSLEKGNTIQLLLRKFSGSPLRSAFISLTVDFDSG